MADMQKSTEDVQPVCEAPQPAWEEKELEEALAHLERLQEQIDAMRRTIPSIVEPMTRPVKDKAKLFAQIKTAATGAVDGVHALRSSWNSEETQSLLNKSRESLEKDSDLSKATIISRYGWNGDVDMG